MDKLNEKIVHLRKEHKVTQKKLADAIGISRTTLAHYEIGRRKPDYEILQRIADFFHVSTDYLLGRDFTPEEQQLWNDIYLPLDKLLEKYDFGIELTEEEIRDAIEYIKAKRIMREKK